MEERLRKSFPDYKTGLLHGRMKSAEKEEVMTGFKSNEIHILVSTTVIEVGVDVPNSTVMVIEHAERFGLSQLHQLRGRVGRRDIKAVVYFLYPHQRLSALAAARLHALQDFSNLGDGFKIALRDLELRGAGNILGRHQSGRINQIGLNLYCEMLSQAVEKLRE